MHSPEKLEVFFEEYLPTVKHIIDKYWNTDRQELLLFLEACNSSGLVSGWMVTYFEDILTRAKTAPHTYTDPWKTL